MTVKKNLVAPEGGWGWVIMIAFIANHILIIPIQQNFGFLFKDTFKLMDMSGANVASIISTHSSVSMLLGTGTAPLIKKFGLRKVAVGGSILFSVGLLSLTFASSYLSFMICYGIITAVGLGLIRLTNTLSLNLYFAKRRRRVMGVAVALRSFGSIIFPHLLVLLLTVYGTVSSVLVIAGICFHTICFNLLLRPVEWYLKDNESGIELNLLYPEDNHEDKYSDREPVIKNKSGVFWKKVIHYFDLTLFKDPVFLNITIGMMFTSFADMSFSTLFPLILADLGFDNNRIALFVSTSYISNIIVRFSIPFIGDYFKRSSKFMYTCSCLLVVVGRFGIILFARTATSVTIPILWGAAKGMRTVYWVVIVADNVPREQLASAESISLVLSGTLSFICGPLLGIVKDVTGTYVNCVYVLNGLTLFTCLLWSVEAIFSVCKKKKIVCKRHSI